jgi:tetratricopeptide (TPR) repeat protein
VTFLAGAGRFTALLLGIVLCGAAPATKTRTDPVLERDFAAFKKAYMASDFSSALALAKSGGADARRRKNAHYIAVFLRDEGIAQEYLDHDAAALAAFSEALKTDSAPGRAYDLGGIGRADEELERYPDAMTALTRALVLDRRLQDRRREAIDLSTLGSVYEDVHRYNDSLTAELRAVALAQKLGDRKLESGPIEHLGQVYEDLGRHSDALAAYKRMLDLNQQLGRKFGEARALEDSGDVYEDMARFTDALQADESALTLDTQTGNKLGQAFDLSDIGRDQTDLGRYTDALDAENKALALFRSLGNRSGESLALGSIGLVDHDRGLFPEALSSQRAAFAIDRALSDRGAQAKDLTNIGNLYEDLGEYDAALGIYQQTLEIDRALGDREDQALDLTNLGTLYEDLGRSAEALAQFREALPMIRQAGDATAEAGDLNNIGVVLSVQRHFPQALEADQQALAIDRRLGSQLGEETVLANIGDAYVRMGRYSDALPDETQALTIARSLGDGLAEAADLGDLGTVLYQLNRYAEARTNHQQAAALDRSLGIPNLWKSLHMLALDETKLGMQSDALVDFGAAIDEIETLRGGLANENDRRSFFATTTSVYEDYLEYLLELNGRFPKAGYDRKALQIFEREQARAFLEEIGKSSARRFSDVPPEVVAQETQLADALAHDATELARARAATAVDLAAVDELEKHQAGLEQQQTALEATIRTQYPAYYGLTHPQPIDPAALQQLLRPGEAMLVYAVLDKRTAVWLIGRGDLHLYDVPLGADDLTKGVADFRKPQVAIQYAIDQKTKAIGLVRVVDERRPDFERASHALYASLLPPEVQSALAKASDLFIVPTGPLYGLPWEALVTNETATGAAPHYLIEDHAISYLSSASLLGVLREAETHRLATPHDPLVAFADPNFEETAARRPRQAATSQGLRSRALAEVVSRGAPDPTFTPLPGSAKEVEAVAAMLKAPAVTHPLYENDDASRATVFRLDAADCTKGPCLKDYRYVIFATHAVLPDQVSGLLQPALVLAHPNDDGFLTMGDVFGLTLDADVVSLSACNTGGGTPTRGDGVRGLTQAFMYAGTPAVTVTLWDIADAAAQQITPSFYAGLKAGKSPAEALRQAKLQMLAGGNPLFADPFFWAPTVLFGDGVGPQR